MFGKCKCGNKTEWTAIQKKGSPHMGIYCNKCGLWQKWIDRNERNLLIIHDIPIKYV